MKTATLLETVKRFKKIKPSTLPICANVKNDNGTMEFTNLQTHLIVNTGFPGKFLIPLKNLDKIASKLPKDSEIEISGDNQIVTILVIGGGKFNLTPDNFEDYPCLPEVKIKNGFINSETVSQIKRAVKYVANDELRPVMNCVYVSKHVVASDAHRMVYFKHENHAKEPFLVSSEAVKLLGDDQYNVFYSDHYTLLINDQEAIYSRVDGNYPNYEYVIPTKADIQYTISKKEFVPAIKLADISANQASQLIRFKFNCDSVIVSSQDIAFASSYEQSIACKNIGKDKNGIEIGFKSTFLLDLLSECEDSVTLKMSTPDRAMIINNEMLLMPMMINC